jgi:hypothetical protein
MPRYSALHYHSLRSLVASVAVLVSFGCAPSSWRPASYLAPGALPPDTRVQVWRCGRPMVLRDVTVEADSVRGRIVDPLGGPPRGRVVLARSDIDSLRQQPRDPANWFGAGLGVGVVAAIVVPRLVPYLVRLLGGPRGT